MFKKYFPLIVISYLLCTSCDSHEDVVQIDMDSFQKLEGRALDLEILGIPRIKMVDSLIISINQKGDRLFSIIDPNRDSIIKEFGELDLIPEQFSFPIFPADVVPKKSGMFSIHDLDRNTFYDYNLFYDSVELTLLEKISFPEGYFPNYIGFRSDSLNIYSPEYGGMLVLFGKSSIDNKVVDYFPVPNVEIQEDQKWISYQVSMAVNLEKELIAINPLLFGELDIYNFDGTLQTRSIYDISNHVSKDLASQNLTNTSLKRYAIEMEVTSNSIYILLDGNTFLNIRERGPYPNSRILEYDWEGNFKNGYILDRPILSFTFDERSNSFYGVSLVKEEEVLINYKIKEYE